MALASKFISQPEILVSPLQRKQPQDQEIQTVMSDTASEQEVESLQFLEALPFSINKNSKIEDQAIDDLGELLANGHQKTTYALDGFYSFHHIKFVTSNAKQMSKLFRMTMGFKEVAYRGLETGSKYLASHVVQNNGVTIELISDLESCKDNVSFLPAAVDDMDNFNRYNTLSLVDGVHEQTKPIISSLIEDLLQQHLIKTMNEKSLLFHSIEGSKQFKEWKNDYSKSILKLTEIISTNEEDIIDSHMYSDYLFHHGEGVTDTAFLVEDVEEIFKQAVLNGAEVLKYPKVVSDCNGSVKMATIVIPDTDIRHTLIENIDFTGAYLPGYVDPLENERYDYTAPVEFADFDHCVENYTWNQMMKQAEFYAKIFKFHKFWSVDEEDISTESSSLNSTVMTSSNEKIKIPINEPSKGKMKSQIEEFYESNGGPGFQHVALKTNNIVETVAGMRANGIEFNSIGEDYYKTLLQRMRKDDVCLKEDMDVLMDLNILVDYDPSTRNKKTKICNYILQIFTKPLNDRPTLFLEVIQRHHHNGFGKGTFKGLFASIEEQQKLRGNLVPSDH